MPFFILDMRNEIESDRILNLLCKSTHFYQGKISVASCANVMIQIVPIVCFEFLRGERHPRHLVRVMMRCMESVSIVNIEGWIRMSIKCKYCYS